MLGGLKCYTSTHIYPFVCSQHVVTGQWTLRLNCLWSTGPDIPLSIEVYSLPIWWQNMVTKFLSSLVQGMACHQFGASHCVNQWWCIVNWNLRNKLMLNYIEIYTRTRTQTKVLVLVLTHFFSTRTRTHTHAKQSTRTRTQDLCTRPNPELYTVLYTHIHNV